ncbi:MAG: ABC-F family ATP-binding cassette domain-containing protein [Lachnospiraceae bacterium]|jgi:ATP-binding cassette subfamily F protein uup|nr:ABC-F family ATP-binding cassette domain-containing protein [Lachnospiraceae bacterium]
MNLVTIENLTKSYTERLLFDHASFSVQEGEKVGLIGINGTGKSTLLKIMAGEETPDEGTVTMARHAVLRYLPQHPVFDPDLSSLSCVLRNNVTEENRWSIESDAKAMLTRLGITDYDQPAGQLSGGQRKRLALVSALLSPADILLLDEPTNHLDGATADWLEEYLKKWRGALVMVTHDRYFLDSVTDRIVEIDKGQMYSCQGGYSGFLEWKAQRQEMEQASERKRQSILRVELEWIRRGARARSTKQKAHIRRYEELRDRKGPQADSQVELSSASSRLGRTTLELSHISKGYKERMLIRDFSYIFLKGDRVGFIGPNGCGKSTLMKMLAGLLRPDEGGIVVGQTVCIGYYAQELSCEKRTDGDGAAEADSPFYMDPNQNVIDYIRDTAEYVRTADGLISASAMLEKFLFPPQMQYTRIGRLSGGERRRLNLLRVLAKAPNVLVLDEPTNNLDIATLTILEDYLDSYEGIVIAVSHDRYFLDRTMRRIFAFGEDGSLTQYEGGYTDYALRREAEVLEAAKSGGTGAAAGNGAAAKGGRTEKGEAAWDRAAERERRSRGPQKLRFTYKEQKEYEVIETEMAALEEKLADLEEEIVRASRDFVKLGGLMKEKEETETALEAKMERWVYLEELAAKIAGQEGQ